jgi:chaperone modulatory protein CbpM
MTSIDAVGRLVGIEIVELEHWIGERWVLPENAGAGYVFQEVDVARVRLIVELKRDLAMDEDAIAMALRLLDQVYALRRRLMAMTEAIDALPPDLRDAVVAKLQGDA